MKWVWAVQCCEGRCLLLSLPSWGSSGLAVVYLNSCTRPLRTGTSADQLKDRGLSEREAGADQHINLDFYARSL